MYCNWPQLTLQLLLIRHHCLHFTTEHMIVISMFWRTTLRSMTSKLCVHWQCVLCPQVFADNRNGELLASYETLTLGMALVKEPSFGTMRMPRILSELDTRNILFTNIFFENSLEDIYPFCGGKWYPCFGLLGMFPLAPRRNIKCDNMKGSEMGHLTVVYENFFY